MADADILAKYGVPVGDQAILEKYGVPKTEAPGMLESAGRGALQGATLGFGDELAGGAQAVWDAAGKNSTSDLVKDYIKHRDEARIANERAQKANPWSYGLGQVAGGIGSLAAAPEAIAGAGLKGAVGLGALQGVGSSNANTVGGQAVDALKGAGFGAAGYGAGKLISAAVPTAESAGELAEDAAIKHLRPTPKVAQTLGDEKLHEIARETLDRGLIKPFSKVGDTLENIEGAKDEAGQLIGDVVDNSKATVDPVALAAKIKKEVVDPLRGNPEMKDVVKHLDGKVQDLLDTWAPNAEEAVPEPVPVQAVEEAKRTAQNNINYMTDAKPKQEQIMNYASKLRQASEGAIDDPSFVPAKQSFGNMAQAEKIAGRTAGLTDGGTGLIGHLGDMNASQLAMEAAAHGAPGPGAAIAAGRALSRGRIQSTIAAGADATSKFLGNNPNLNNVSQFIKNNAAAAGGVVGRDVMGTNGGPTLDANQITAKLSAHPEASKFAGVINQAASNGPDSLASTHFILSQTEPEYQKALSENQ